MASNMRGLTKFVTDVRFCSSEDAVKTLVAKELAKIRAKFASGKLKGYDLKKYVWKIIYCYMLGLPVDFGHMEAVQLISMPRFSEKLAGHVAITLMLDESMDLLRLVIQSMKRDMGAGSPEEIQCLALHTVANVGGEEFAESLAVDVQRLMLASTSRNFVRKKACLALLRLYRKYPDVVAPDALADQVLGLLDDPNLGVAVSAASLVLGLVARDPGPYHAVVPLAIALLGKLVDGGASKGYLYYKTPCPWLQVKLLKILQYFPAPADRARAQHLAEVLGKILAATEVTKSVNKNNADYSILFEAVALVTHLNLQGVKVLQEQTLALLGRYVGVREPNIRYLGLEAMARFAAVEGAVPGLRPHLPKIQYSLKQADVSIRRRALDLMFALADQDNVVSVTAELLEFLAKADFDSREDIVLKIAILAERYATDFCWYVDLMLELIAQAGDFIPEEILFRVVQIVSVDPSVQEHAAAAVLRRLQSVHAHESLVVVAGYLLGEYGHLLSGASARAQFEALYAHFGLVEASTKALLLTAFTKIGNWAPRVAPRLREVLDFHQGFVDQEIQQRALEYAELLDRPALAAKVWEVMPAFPAKDSLLPTLLRKRQGKTTDRDVWKEEASSTSDSEAEEEIEEEVEEEELEEELPGQKIALVRKLLLEDSGALYDSEVLQVGAKLKSAAAGEPKLKMILYFGNKTSSRMSNVWVSDPGAGAVTLQRKPAAPFEVLAGAQVMLMLLWTAQSPLPACPEHMVTFTLEGVTRTLYLRIPLSVTR